MADNALVLLERQKSEILKILPTSMSPDRWWQLLIQIVRNPQLARCTPESLVEAARQAAVQGLELDGEEAVIVPYGQVATMQAMWRGLVRRVVEAGAADHIFSEVVHEGEHIRFQSGTNGRTIDHEPTIDRRGKIIGAYAIVILPNRITDYEYMTADDLEAVRRAALRISGGKPSPAWSQFPGEMYKKSVIRRLCKRLKGKRNTDETQRLQAVMEGMKRTEPDETPPLSPDEMPRAAEPEKGGEAENRYQDAAATHDVPPSAVSGRAPSALVDEEQLKLIDDNSQSTAIAPKRYTQLMREFGITDEHQLSSDKVPQFLERMHQLANG